MVMVCLMVAESLRGFAEALVSAEASGGAAVAAEVDLVTGGRF
jgi:3-oxoacyl-(acyl-carrier-protein) synthase